MKNRNYLSAYDKDKTHDQDPYPITSILFACLLFFCGSNFSYANDEPPLVSSPSFDCKKASTRVEKAICSSSLLSGLDIWMAEVYKIATKLDTTKKLKQQQLAWLKSRESCLDSPGEGYFGNTGLPTCYADRIYELLEQYDIKTDKKLYLTLARKMGFNVPEKFKTNAEKHVFFMNLEGLMQGFFDNHCGYNEYKILYYKSPILLININGSTVCGGTSHAISGKIEYCEKDGEFRRGGVWTCKPDNLLDKEFLLSYIAVNSFDNFSKSRANDEPNNIFIDYLYSYPIHSLAESSSNARQSRVFSEQYLKIFEDNIELFLPATESHKKDFKELLSGMKCAEEAITATSDWERIFNRHPPDWAGDFWYGRQFTGCNKYDKRIVDQRYTYKELYIELWRRLYLAGGMSRATKLLNKLMTRNNG